MTAMNTSALESKRVGKPSKLSKPSAGAPSRK
jgi:hypothetical protein